MHLSCITSAKVNIQLSIKVSHYNRISKDNIIRMHVFQAQKLQGGKKKGQSRLNTERSLLLECLPRIRCWMTDPFWGLSSTRMTKLSQDLLNLPSTLALAWLPEVLGLKNDPGTESPTSNPGC